MVTRRAFLDSIAAGLTLGGGAIAAQPSASQRKRLAVVTTEWRYHSHAWHMAERFLVGYPIEAAGIGRPSTWSRPMSTRSPPTT